MHAPPVRGLGNHPLCMTLGKSVILSYLFQIAHEKCADTKKKTSGLQAYMPGIVKAGVHVKAVFKSLNTAFLPISRSRFKRR